MCCFYIGDGLKFLFGVIGKRYDELCIGIRGFVEVCFYDRNYVILCED